MLWTTPNFLTLSRIILIPVFVLLFSWTFYKSSALLFALAAFTDWLDGYLSRLWKQQSSFGAFLDPVADKLIVVTALVMLVYRDPQMIIVFPVLVIIGREVAVSALREWMAKLSAQHMVEVSWLGKLKTTLQLFSIICLVYRDPIGTVDVFVIGLLILYIATFMTVWSVVNYLRQSWKQLVN